MLLKQLLQQPKNSSKMLVCDPFREQDQEELVKEVIGLDSSSFASNLCLADMVRLHTYIRPLKLAYIDARP